MMNFNLKWLKTAAEVPAFILFFAFSLCETTTYSFSIFRSCYVDFGYDKSDCELLGTGDNSTWIKEIEEEVQPYANYVLMVQEIITQVTPAVVVLFLGPWSDKHGRRPLLIINMIGFCLGGVFAIVVSSVDSLSSWYFTGSSLLIALFGGVNPFIMAIICYISDITTEKNRGFRMGIFEGAMAAGSLIGTVIISYLLEAGGYVSIYAIATGCFFIILLFNIFVLVESLKFDKDKKPGRLNIFSVKNFKEIVRTVFRKRNNNLTILIIFGMLTATLLRFIGHADVSIFYMFLRVKLNWDMEKYTLYKTFRELLRIIVTIAGITLLHNKLRIREAPLIVVTSILTVASMLLQGWATEDWHIYLAAVIRSFSGILAPLVRSFLSKLVIPEETGKLFALTAAMESLVLLGGIPLYTIIYNNTVSVNPGAFNFVTGGLYALLIFFGIVAMFMQKVAFKEDVFIDRKVPNKKDEDDINEMKTADSNGTLEQ